MRYSIDAPGVAGVVSDVSLHMQTISQSVSAALNAADDATAALTGEALAVSAALESAMAGRRVSGPGISSHMNRVLDGIELATFEYIAGDEQMAAQTARLNPEPASGANWRFGRLPR